MGLFDFFGKDRRNGVDNDRSRRISFEDFTAGKRATRGGRTDR